jgi:hypothetical protein
MKKAALALSISTLAMLAMLRLAAAQTAPAISPAISTPDKVETRLGALDFKDGAPSAETVSKIYDNLDFTHAFETFVNTFQGVNLDAAHKGFLGVGVKDNEILVFSKLMDAKSLFLTANADTVYFVGFIDLSKGPMVLETPPDALGTLDDDHARNGYARHRYRVAVPFCFTGCRQELLRRCEDLQDNVAEEYPRPKVLVAHALRQPDALDARHAAALPTRR